jgi:DNA invertase Pin-like site-specific DNA recombinase
MEEHVQVQPANQAPQTVSFALAHGRPGKIAGAHLDRLAVVYVRQSTLWQVHHHQESGRLQYALKDRAIALGWSPQRVLIIDEDQGRSGASAAHRTGFQRLVAEVGLKHVGIVLGIEISRLARSNSDWYQLLDMCALSQTLIADGEGLYDPQEYNDRLLLGLKGTMSEAELHMIRQRLDAGRWAKARRGELRFPVPTGYVRRPSGEVVKDPDEQVQGTIQLLFTTFERCRSINGVVRALVAHGVQIPVRERCGPERGSVRWSRPSARRLRKLFYNPAYAGAYVYGHRTGQRQRPGTDAGSSPPGRLEEAWEVCLKDHHPAYITWQEYVRNVRQIQANAPQQVGAVREGPSLLAGLVVCGRCGRRLITRYSHNGRSLRYVCEQGRKEYQAARCQSVPGGLIDEAVSRLVLEALEPLALDLSLQVAHDLEAERAQVLSHWTQRLERAHYEVNRAFRQYNAVEPENRLVARQLEQQWEAALQAEAALQLEYDRVVAQEPVPLRTEELKAIRQVAADIPALWHASSTTAADRQALVRQLIDRVVVTLTGDTEQMQVDVQWAGGDRTSVPLIRPVRSLKQLSYYPALLQRVIQLRTEGADVHAIACRLTEEGWRSVKGTSVWTPLQVGRLLDQPEARSLKMPHTRLTEGLARNEHEWTTHEFAEVLAISRDRLHSWLRKGILQTRKVRQTAGLVNLGG